MSNFYYTQEPSPPLEDDLDFEQTPTAYRGSGYPDYQTYQAQHIASGISQQQLPPVPNPYHQSNPLQQPCDMNDSISQAWATGIVPSNYPSQAQDVTAIPAYLENFSFTQEALPTLHPTATSTWLHPGEADVTRASRSTSFASNASSSRSTTYSDVSASRSVSPNADEMSRWGFRNAAGNWSCAYPGCSSRSTFNRGCDLRKHYKRHTKSLFCREKGCPQATEGGFSSKKDRARHEAKHNPTVVCEWDGCERLFSRVDNMKDHVRRVHRRKVSS